MADRQIERFFRQNFPVIRAKCARMLGEREEAADVAQETFVRLCESGMVHEEPGARARWIYRTSSRLAIDRLRRRKLGIESHAESAREAEGEGRPADEVLAARQQLLALASAAPRDEMEVAILCRVDGLTQAETAEVCEISERTVRRLLESFDRRIARDKESR